MSASSRRESGSRRVPHYMSGSTFSSRIKSRKAGEPLDEFKSLRSVRSTRGASEPGRTSVKARTPLVTSHRANGAHTSSKASSMRSSNDFASSQFVNSYENDENIEENTGEMAFMSSNAASSDLSQQLLKNKDWKDILKEALVQDVDILYNVEDNVIPEDLMMDRFAGNLKGRQYANSSLGYRDNGTGNARDEPIFNEGYLYDDLDNEIVSEINQNIHAVEQERDAKREKFLQQGPLIADERGMILPSNVLPYNTATATHAKSHKSHKSEKSVKRSGNTRGPNTAILPRSHMKDNKKEQTREVHVLASTSEDEEDLSGGAAPPSLNRSQSVYDTNSDSMESDDIRLSQSKQVPPGAHKSSKSKSSPHVNHSRLGRRIPHGDLDDPHSTLGNKERAAKQLVELMSQVHVNRDQEERADKLRKDAVDYPESVPSNKAKSSRLSRSSSSHYDGNKPSHKSHQSSRSTSHHREATAASPDHGKAMRIGSYPKQQTKSSTPTRSSRDLGKEYSKKAHTSPGNNTSHSGKVLVSFPHVDHEGNVSHMVLKNRESPYSKKNTAVRPHSSSRESSPLKSPSKRDTSSRSPKDIKKQPKVTPTMEENSRVTYVSLLRNKTSSKEKHRSPSYSREDADEVSPMPQQDNTLEQSYRRAGIMARRAIEEALFEEEVSAMGKSSIKEDTDVQKANATHVSDVLGGEETPYGVETYRTYTADLADLDDLTLWENGGTGRSAKDGSGSSISRSPAIGVSEDSRVPADIDQFVDPAGNTVPFGVNPHGYLTGINTKHFVSRFRAIGKGPINKVSNAELELASQIAQDVKRLELHEVNDNGVHTGDIDDDLDEYVELHRKDLQREVETERTPDGSKDAVEETSTASVRSHSATNSSDHSAIVVDDNVLHAPETPFNERDTYPGPPPATGQSAFTSTTHFTAASVLDELDSLYSNPRSATVQRQIDEYLMRIGRQYDEAEGQEGSDDGEVNGYDYNGILNRQDFDMKTKLSVLCLRMDEMKSYISRLEQAVETTGGTSVSQLREEREYISESPSLHDNNSNNADSNLVQSASTDEAILIRKALRPETHDSLIAHFTASLVDTLRLLAYGSLLLLRSGYRTIVSCVYNNALIAGIYLVFLVTVRHFALKVFLSFTSDELQMELISLFHDVEKIAITLQIMPYLTLGMSIVADMVPYHPEIENMASWMVSVLYMSLTYMEDGTWENTNYALSFNIPSTLGGWMDFGIQGSEYVTNMMSHRGFLLLWSSVFGMILVHTYIDVDKDRK